MKKTIVQVNRPVVLGEIDDDLVEEYIYQTCPIGVDVIIGDSIDDVARQIRLRLKLQGNRDLELNDKETCLKCVEKVRIWRHRPLYGEPHQQGRRGCT